MNAKAEYYAHYETVAGLLAVRRYTRTLTQEENEALLTAAGQLLNSPFQIDRAWVVAMLTEAL